MVKDRGFTLLELLIAIAIFSVVAYITFNSVRFISFNGEKIIENHGQLSALKKAIAIMENDFLQMTPRSIRNQDGVFIAALFYEGGSEVRFSRAGKFVDFGEAGINLQRVNYFLRDNKLYRRSWDRLDRALGDDGKELLILDKVQDFRLEFLSDEKWVGGWPEYSGNNNFSSGRDDLPRMILIILELENGVNINRVLPGV